MSRRQSAGVRADNQAVNQALMWDTRTLGSGLNTAYTLLQIFMFFFFLWFLKKYFHISVFITPYLIYLFIL